MTVATLDLTLGAGEIRGQFSGSRVGITHLSGAQAGTADDSTGRGYVVTNSSGTFVSLSVSTVGISGISLLYRGSDGRAVVMCSFPAVPLILGALCPLNPVLVSHMRAGHAYVTVFTSDLPDGTKCALEVSLEMTLAQAPSQASCHSRTCLTQPRHSRRDCFQWMASATLRADSLG